MYIYAVVRHKYLFSRFSGFVYVHKSVKEYGVLLQNN